METILFESTKELKRSLKELEQKLNLKIIIEGKKAAIDGSPIDEYEASLVLEAMSFGFSAKKSLQLKDPDILFRKFAVKNYTRRKNLFDVKSRVIGTEGKTRKTIEEITGCNIIIKKGEVGIIGSSESIDEATTAITSIIRGSKQANAYSYLERMNREKKKMDDSLGLIAKEKSKKSNRTKS